MSENLIVLEGVVTSNIVCEHEIEVNERKDRGYNHNSIWFDVSQMLVDGEWININRSSKEKKINAMKLVLEISYRTSTITDPKTGSVVYLNELNQEVFDPYALVRNLVPWHKQPDDKKEKVRLFLTPGKTWIREDHRSELKVHKNGYTVLYCYVKVWGDIESIPMLETYKKSSPATKEMDVFDGIIALTDPVHHQKVKKEELIPQALLM